MNPKAVCLLVDDYTDGLIALEQLLRELVPNMKFVRANTGLEAVHLVSNSPPEGKIDIVMIDCNLIYSDDRIAALTVMAESLDPPVIIVTSTRSADYVRAKLPLPISYQVFTKPFDIDALVHAMENAQTKVAVQPTRRQ